MRALITNNYAQLLLAWSAALNHEIISFEAFVKREASRTPPQSATHYSPQKA